MPHLICARKYFDCDGDYMKMILQNILFPAIGRCAEQEMYFRTASKSVMLVDGEKLTIPQNKSVKFDTYFNAFSLDKWIKYSNVKQVVLNLRISGKAKIVVMRQERSINAHILSEIIAEKIVDSPDSVLEISIPCVTNSALGAICFMITALDNDVVFEGGNYSAELRNNEYRDVKIAMAICTYKREKYIEKNLRLLNEAYLENPKSYLYDKFEVFISDNAQTLDIDKLSSDKIHIFRNKNAGGTGGFTRGMIEIGKAREDKKITHILVMDDDVTVEPEAIYRTLTMLSCLKGKYLGAFIGGAMLRSDIQYKQAEAGAYWHGGNLLSLKQNLDLRNFETCLFNEVEENPEFNAWWFCCFPAEIPENNNLPIPIFIRGDDLEYGLRNMKQLILMNGICVWHEPFENKYSSFLYYYILRNRLIVNSIHDMSMDLKSFKRLLYCQVHDEIRIYRYKNANLLMRGVEDFLKGVDWLRSQKGDELHQEIMKSGYSLKLPEEIDGGVEIDFGAYERSKAQGENLTFKTRVIRKLTENGHSLSIKRSTATVPVVGARPVNVYRCARVINYDYCGRKCFVTVRDGNEAKACVKRLKQLNKKLDRLYYSAIKDYHDNFRQVTSLEFWMGYLGI